MLVLSRQRDQSIKIGDEIEIKVVDIRGDKVRLGINAPRRISVFRTEIYDMIQRENQDAAKVQADEVSSVVDSPQSTPLQNTPMSNAQIDEALKVLFSLSDENCLELLKRFRQQKPDVWKRATVDQ